MIEYITTWLQPYETWLLQLGIISAALFVFSLLLLPWLLCRIPVDYFQKAPRQHTWRTWLNPTAILRNLLGMPILLAGIVMLVLPGQGLLTLVLGVVIMDFPGKYRLEQRIIRLQGVLPAINWCRKRFDVTEITISKLPDK